MEWRAELPFAGRRSLDIVADALRPLGRLVVVAPEGLECPDAAMVASQDTYLGSLAAGMAQVKSEKFLLCTADVPAIQPEHARRFLELCPPDCDLAYSIVRVEACEAAFPGMKRTTLRLKQGRFTGGNLAVLDRAGFERSMPLMQQAYAQRKSVLGLAKILGPSLLGRVALGMAMPFLLDIPKLEIQVSRALGMRVRAIESPDASLAADVDSAEQFLAMKAILG